jgi:hypothetical protein
MSPPFFLPRHYEGPATDHDIYAIIKSRRRKPIKSAMKNSSRVVNNESRYHQPSSQCAPSIRRSAPVKSFIFMMDGPYVTC